MAYRLPERHERTAARIPADVRKTLTTAQVLARCEYHDQLHKTAMAMDDPRSARLFFMAADTVLTAPHANLPAEVLAKAEKTVTAAVLTPAVLKAIDQQLAPLAAQVEQLAKQWNDAAGRDHHPDHALQGARP